MVKTELWGDLFKMGALTALVAVALPEASFADANDVNALITNVATGQLSALPYILSVVCYIMGIFMLTSGALKLKAHAEKPDSEKLAPGVARVLVGGAVTSVPALSKLIQSSTSIGTGSGASFSSFGINFS
jgi:hypothetical protein